MIFVFYVKLFNNVVIIINKKVYYTPLTTIAGSWNGVLQQATSHIPRTLNTDCSQKGTSLWALCEQGVNKV